MRRILDRRGRREGQRTREEGRRGTGRREGGKGTGGGTEGGEAETWERQRRDHKGRGCASPSNPSLAAALPGGRGGQEGEPEEPRLRRDSSGSARSPALLEGRGAVVPHGSSRQSSPAPAPKTTTPRTPVLPRGGRRGTRVPHCAPIVRAQDERRLPQAVATPIVGPLVKTGHRLGARFARAVHERAALLQVEVAPAAEEEGIAVGTTIPMLRPRRGRAAGKFQPDPRESG